MAEKTLPLKLLDVLKRATGDARPVALQPGRHVLVLKRATEPRAFIPKEHWTPETVTATWVEAKIVESDVQSLAGETTTGFVWGTAAKKVVTGDQIEVETFAKKTALNRTLWMTKVR